MTPGPLRALIFDFDGVILDSNAVKTDAFRTLFARYPAHSDAMMRYHEAHVSDSRYAKFAYLVETLLGRRGDRQAIDALADDYAEVLRERMEACAFVPGSEALLKQLDGRLPLYLASVTPEPELLRLLDVHGLRRFFTGVYGCPPWTKAEAVGAIVKDLAGPRGIALIGDSAGDQRSAAAHGVEFIARDSGLPFDPPVTGIRDMTDIASQIAPRIPA